MASTPTFPALSIDPASLMRPRNKGVDYAQDI